MLGCFNLRLINQTFTSMTENFFCMFKLVSFYRWYKIRYTKQKWLREIVATPGNSKDKCAYAGINVGWRTTLKTLRWSVYPEKVKKKKKKQKRSRERRSRGAPEDFLRRATLEWAAAVASGACNKKKKPLGKNPYDEDAGGGAVRGLQPGMVCIQISFSKAREARNTMKLGMCCHGNISWYPVCLVTPNATLKPTTNPTKIVLHPSLSERMAAARFHFSISNTSDT